MATATSNIVEIEVDAENNQQLLLLGKELRGRWDWKRCREPDAARFYHDPVIPGQALGVDLETGRLYRRDLLHEPEHTRAREKIEKKYALPKEFEEFGNTHLPTAVHWMNAAVDQGLARVIKGQLPKQLDAALGEPNLIPKRKGDEKIDALTDAVTKMSGILEKFVTAVAGKTK